MNQLSLRYRLLAGIALVGLGSVLFLGCNGGSSTTPPAVALTTTVNEPTDTTATDIATAAVKPADPATAVVTLDTPTIVPSAGTSLIPSGTESQLQVDCGNTGVVTGSLPLDARSGAVEGSQQAVLPEGDNAIQLSPDTSFELDDSMMGSLADTRGHAYPRLRVSSMKVLFSAHRGHPCTWTLPSHYKLHMVRSRNHMYVLDNSYLDMSWSGKRAVPPSDGKVTITANLYNGTTKVAGPLVKTVTVQNDSAVFTGNNNVPFNRVGIVIDLRDKK